MRPERARTGHALGQNGLERGGRAMRTWWMCVCVCVMAFVLLFVFVCECVCVCVCVCTRVGGVLCVRACVRPRARVAACARACLLSVDYTGTVAHHRQPSRGGGSCTPAASFSQGRLSAATLAPIHPCPEQVSARPPEFRPRPPVGGVSLPVGIIAIIISGTRVRVTPEAALTRAMLAGGQRHLAQRRRLLAEELRAAPSQTVHQCRC